jgi:transposase-like protein
MAKKYERNQALEAIRLASTDEASAVAFIEGLRWGDSPACPRCGDMDVYAMRDRATGERERNYRWRCRGCGKMFSVRTGTVFEETRLPLRVWCYAFWRCCASKKGISALQLSRELEITHKSALFLLHRIRLAMDFDPTEGNQLSGIIEADETFIGGKLRVRAANKREASRSRYENKAVVFAMVERGGRVKAMHVDRIHAGNLTRELVKNVAKGSRVMTDEAKHYRRVGRSFVHETVKHADYEYVRGDVTTNTVEGFFALLKRGVYGTFHSVSKQHLHRYLAEFSFRYNHRKSDDGERTLAAIRGSEGKRLMYKIPDQEFC